MSGWLANGAAALRFAGDRPGLWLPGALAQLAFLGWLPLVATVASLPDAGDLGFFAIGLVRSPPRIAALVLMLVAGFALLCLLVAFAEVALERAGGGAAGEAPGLGMAIVNRLAIIMVLAVPVVGAGGLLALGISLVAPDEYRSSNLSTPVLIRIIAAVWPLIVAVLGVLVACQAVGGIAKVHAAGHHPRAPMTAVAAALVDLVHRPVRRLATAVAGLAADLLLLVLALAMLRVLWAPIEAELRLGGLSRPSTLLLLVGFVAIWLALVLAAGALRATMSTWWWLEVEGAGQVATASGTAVENR
jgi:hypothetical protein